MADGTGVLDFTPEIEAATAAELLRRNFLRSMFNEFLGSGIAMKLANKPREAK